MDERQEQMYKVLCEMTGEQVAQVFLDYHGTCLLSDGFRKHLQVEGYMDEDPPVYESDGENCCQNCEDCSGWRECGDYGLYD